MTVLLYLAALLAFALGAAHSLLGERYILVRLFRKPDLPRLFGGTWFTTRTLRFAWHLTTVAWWGCAALLVQLARGTLTPSGTLLTLGVTFVVSGLLPLVITRGRHWAWLVLLLIGAIALAAGAS